MISLTEEARKELEAYFEGKEKTPIRVYLAPGGCSGPRLALALDEPGEDDETSEDNGLTLCTGSLGCSAQNDVVHMAAKYAAMGRIHFVHARNVAVLENGFEERAHLSKCGSLDMYAILNALYKNGFNGYIRPDHGRMIWGETGRAGYGLYDRALGAAYLNGLWEAISKRNSTSER